MQTIEYFIFDTLDITKQKEIKIEKFKFNSSTLIADFYYELYNKYIVANKRKIRTFRDIIDTISFQIKAMNFESEINNDSFGELLEELLIKPKKLYCIIPVLPIGGTVAKFQNYRIVLRYKEESHDYYPHVHLYNQIGENVSISLIDFKIKGDMNIPKKDKKIIMRYLQDNKDKLINEYKQVVEHKIVKKVEIEFIDEKDFN